MRPKPYALLSLFASEGDRVLGKEELFARVWPGAVVSDGALTQCAHELRRALGPEGADFVRTGPRRGYRCGAPVPDAAGSTPVEVHSERWRRRAPSLIAIGASTAALLAFVRAVTGFVRTRSAPGGRTTAVDRRTAADRRVGGRPATAGSPKFLEPTSPPSWAS